MLRPGTSGNQPQRPQLIFFMITTIIIIGLAITIIFNWHEIKHRLYLRRSSWKYVYKYKQDIRNLYLKLADQGYIEEGYRKIGALRREIKDSFDKGKISRSQYEKLRKEFERY